MTMSSLNASMRATSAPSLQPAMQLDELLDQLPGQHGGHDVVLGMHHHQVDRYLALPFIQPDEPCLYLIV